MDMKNMIQEQAKGMIQGQVMDAFQSAIYEEIRKEAVSLLLNNEIGRQLFRRALKRMRAEMLIELTAYADGRLDISGDEDKKEGEKEE